MTADERLALIQAKIERAKKHIIDLEGAVRTFLDSNPYKVGTKRNPQTRQLIYYVMGLAPIPVAVSHVTGDAIQNLRSALDHLAQQLFLVGTNDGRGTGRHVQFLIERGATEYKGRLQRAVKGMRQDAIDALTALEPYKAGKGNDFWVLHELNNTDKHRLLVTVGSSFQSVNIGALMSARLEKATGQSIPVLDAFLRPADNLCPLKIGDELLIDMADAEPNEKMQFRFDVALNESGVVEGKPLLETIQHLADLVSNTVLSFKRCLA